MLDICNPVKSIAAGVLSSTENAKQIAELSRRIEEAKVVNPKNVKRLEADLESFVMSKLSTDPSYRVDLLKSLKQNEKSYEVLKHVDQDGSIIQTAIDFGKQINLSEGEMLDAIAKKVAKDHSFSQKYGFDTFYKRVGKDQYAKYSAKEIDDSMSILFKDKFGVSEKQYTKERSLELLSSSDESLSKSLGTDVSEISVKEKKALVASFVTDEIVEARAKSLVGDSQILSKIKDLDTSDISDIMKISSYVNGVSDLGKVFAEGKSAERLVIENLKSSDDIVNYVLTNYKNINADDAERLLTKSIELDASLGKRQQSYLRGLIKGDFDAEIVRMRAIDMGMSYEEALYLGSKEGSKQVQDFIAGLSTKKGQGNFSFVVDGVSRKLTAEETVKLIGYDNFLRSDAELSKIVNSTPGLRENIFGQILGEGNSKSIREFFNLDQPVDATNPILHRWFGINADRIKYLDLDIKAATKETAAESNVSKAIYESNSQPLGTVGVASSIEEAKTFADNGYIIVVQDSRALDLVKGNKESKARFVTPPERSNYQYFVRDGKLFVGARTQGLLEPVKRRLGNIGGLAQSYGKLDNVKDALSELALVNGLNATEFTRYLEDLGNGDIIKGYNSFTQPKKGGFGRVYKEVDLEVEYGSLISKSNDDLTNLINDQLKGEGIDDVVQITDKNKDVYVDALMHWMYPEGNPSLIPLLSVSGISKNPSVNKSIISNSLYKSLDQIDADFTYRQLSDISDEYIASGKLQLAGIIDDQAVVDNIKRSLSELYERKEYPAPRKSGKVFSLTKVSTEYIDQIKRGLIRYSDGAKGSERLFEGTSVKSTEGLKRSIDAARKEYEDLWNRYDTDLESRFGTEVPVSVFNDLRDAFIAGLEEFDSKYIDSTIGQYIDNVSKIKGNKYRVSKMTSSADLDGFRKIKKESIEAFNNKTDEATQAIGSTSKKVPTFEEDGFRIVNGVRVTVADGIEDILKNKLPLGSVDNVINNIDYRGLSVADQKKLYKMLDGINSVYQYYIGDTMSFYLRTNPELNTFFSAYKIVDDGTFQLPERLIESVRIPVGKGIDDMDDKLLKSEILKDIQSDLSKGSISNSRLDEIIDSNISSFQGEFEGVRKSEILKQYKDLYAADFVPYTKLYDVPQFMMDSFNQKIGKAKPEIGADMLDEIGDLSIETPFGQKTVREIISEEPQGRLPQVLPDGNKFSKELDAETVATMEQAFISNADRYLVDQIYDNTITYLGDTPQPGILDVYSVVGDKLENLVRVKGGPKLRGLLQMGDFLRQQREIAKGAISNIVGWRGQKFTRKALTKQYFGGGSAKFEVVDSILSDLMRLSDAEFDAAKAKASTPDERVAVELGYSFRSIRDYAFKYVDDPALKKKFNEIAKSGFSNTNGEITKLMALYDEFDDWKLFNMINLDNTVIPGLKRQDWNIDVSDINKEGVDRFNQIFGTNLGKTDISHMISSMANVPGLGFNSKWLDKQLTMVGYQPVLNFIKSTSRITQGFFLGTLPNIVSSIPAYLVKSETARKWMGDISYSKTIDWLADQGILDEIGPQFRTKGIGSMLSGVMRGSLSPTEVNALADTITATLGNAQNVADAFFAPQIFAKHFEGAFRSSDGFYFRNFDDFADGLSKLHPEDAKRIVNEVKANAMRTFKQEVGMIEKKADRAVRNNINTTLHAIGSAFNKTGWGNNILGNMIHQLYKSGKIASYMAKNGFSAQAADEIVAAISKDFGYQTFLQNLVGQAYMVARTQKVAAANMENEDKEDPTEVALAMFKWISYESQAFGSSAPARVFNGIGITGVDQRAVDAAGVNQAQALTAMLIGNITRPIGSKLTAIGFVSAFKEGYNVGGTEEGLKNVFRFMMQASQSNLRYQLMLPKNLQGSETPFSSYKGRRGLFTTIQDQIKGLSSTFYTTSTLTEWSAMRSDKLKDDPDYYWYYHDKDGNELSPFKKSMFGVKEIMKNSRFFTNLNATTGLKGEVTQRAITETPIYKEYAENGVISTKSMSIGAKTDLYKSVGADVFGTQSPLSFGVGDTSLDGGFYTVLENYKAGNLSAIKNKQVEKWLNTLQPTDIDSMMKDIGGATSIGQRRTSTAQIVEKYKDNPRMGWMIVASIADNEYQTKKKALKDYYGKLNKKTGKLDDLKLTEMADQNLRAEVIDKHLKDLQLADREWGQRLFWETMTNEEASKEGSELSKILGVKESAFGEKYISIPKNIEVAIGSLIDTQRYIESGAANGYQDAKSFIRRGISGLPDDLKLSVIAQLDEDIDKMNISEESRIDLKLAVLDGSPELLDKLPEIEQKFGKEIADDYRSRWFELYKDTDRLVDTWATAQQMNQATGAGRGKGSIAFGRVQQPKEVTVKLPEISINRISDRVTSKGINSNGSKLLKLDDKYKVSFKALSAGNSKDKGSIPTINPIGDLSAPSSVYFSEGKQGPKSTQRTKFTSKKVSEIKKKGS